MERREERDASELLAVDRDAASACNGRRRAPLTGYDRGLAADGDANVDIAPLDEVALPEVAAFVAGLQADPVHHIGYLGTDADGLAEQLRELEPLGLPGTMLVRDPDGDLLGLLGAEWDTDPPRVWWHGPLVRDGGDWHDLADRLYAAATGLLPDEVTQQELAPDQRNLRVEAFARHHGFHREVASAALACGLPGHLVTERPPPDGLSIQPMDVGDREAVAALHDRLFPGTHTPGARIDEGERRLVLISRRVGEVVGYVAAEVQEDGDGYLDFLGVEPASQRQGVGAALVLAACDRLYDAGSHRAHLTVREDNLAARRLYTALGFTEERILVPWRRGV